MVKTNKEILEFIKENEKELSKEKLLEELVNKYDCLLHGSRTNFSSPIKSDWDGLSYFTNTPWVAILKGIYSNFGQNLGYPVKKGVTPYLNIGLNCKKLKEGIGVFPFDENIQAKKGHIYVINDLIGAMPSPRNYEWEIVFNSEKQPITRIEVVPQDFKYPVRIKLIN